MEVSPEDNKPGIGGVVGMSSLVITVRDFVPFVLVEWISGHQIWVQFKHQPAENITVTIYRQLDKQTHNYFKPFGLIRVLGNSKVEVLTSVTLLINTTVSI